MTNKIENVVAEHFAYELLSCITGEYRNYQKSESPDYIFGECGLEIVTSVSRLFQRQNDHFSKKHYKKNIKDLGKSIIPPSDIITDDNGTMLAFGYGGRVTNDVLISAIDKKLDVLNTVYNVKSCDLFIWFFDESSGKLM